MFFSLRGELLWAERNRWLSSGRSTACFGWNVANAQPAERLLAQLEQIRPFMGNATVPSRGVPAAASAIGWENSFRSIDFSQGLPEYA
jgi:hypothetical protein